MQAAIPVERVDVYHEPTSVPSRRRGTVMPLPLLLATCCTISGNVHGVGGDSIAGASIVLHGVRTTATKSDANGRFTVQAGPGAYRLTASTRGYAVLDVNVYADRDLPLDVALEPLDSPKLRQIGRVTVDGRVAPLAGAIPSVAVPRAELESFGDQRAVDALARLPGVTFSRPNGGAASGVSVVSLRGPDPSESLVALDGQLLNDGNTGDLDLSRFPTAALSAIDVTEGLGPQDTNGSNTFGGAIDLVSLRPTTVSHYAASVSSGSFGRNEAWVNATGSRGRLGFALALDRQTEAGYVHTTVPLYSTADPTCAPCATRLASALTANLALATLSWSFAPSAEVTARAFVLGNERDRSAAINGIDANPADAQTPAFGSFIGPGNQTSGQVVRAYQLRARAPLGAGELTSELSASDNSIDFSGASVSAYDLVHRDRRYNAAATWQRNFATSQFAFGGYTREESLTFNAPPPIAITSEATQSQPSIGQTIGVLFARGGFTPSPKLRLDGGVFASHYTTFGSNLDGRLGAIYAASRGTTLRLSVGTGFRAPLLAERYAFAYAQLPLDANGVFTGQGSTNERPEHATEYELGASRELSQRATLDVSLYRTNLRNPVEVFYPLAAVAAGTCADNSYTAPRAACVSYVGNVGNAVYSGAEIRFAQRFPAQHAFLSALYGLNSAYPRDLTAAFANPTSGGNLVNDAQFLRIPQQQGSLALDWADGGWHAAAAAVFRGNNNELGLGPFTTVDALLGKRVRSADISLAATNLLDAGAGRFTLFGGGVPYRGITGQSASGDPVYGPLPTDALHVEPLGLRLIVTVRR